MSAAPANSGSAAVVVEGVSKRFRLANERRTHLKERFVRGRSHFEEFWALRDVTLTVEQGATFGLIGHNGSGKSTLLKLMSGIHRPTSGTISHTGRVSALLELGAGFHPELSGRENVYLNGAILGMRDSQIDAAFDRIVEFSGLEQFVDSPVKVYSSGMYARLGFSIAVHLEPEILIVDEILAVGDEDFQRRCFDYLEQLRARGVTIIFVSHSLGIVQKLCDRVAWLDHGSVREQGEALDVVEAYVADVNRIESRRLAAESDAPAEEATEPTRRGTGELRVTEVTYWSRGAEVATGVVGEPLVVRVGYHVSRPVRDPVFAIGIYGAHGHKVAGPHTAGLKLGSIERDGYIEYAFDALPLQQGHFRLSIGVTDSAYTHVYDHVERGFLLRVQASGRLVDLGGDVLLPGTWRRVPSDGSRDDDA